jgi:multisubunit Na+/H+ antiporter MnhB subunit
MIDVLLALALLGTAAGVLLTRDLYRSVVLFIVFGLLMTLVWVRMQAPDLALAEAAIGAGLTGVLLLDALGHLNPDKAAAVRQKHQQPLLSGLAFLLALGITGLLWLALVGSPDPGVKLSDAVTQQLSASGVEHPVTAVLLSFRAYDTLLEVAVILVAVVVGLALRFSQADQPAETQVLSPLLHRMLIWLLPLMLLVSVYLLWIGSYRSGGAFQAAAVLAALAVLMRMSGLKIPGHDDLRVLRLGLVLGLGLFLLVGSLSMITGGAFLAWPRGWEGSAILLVEAGLTFSLGALLFSLFEASPAPHQARLTIGEVVRE